ncbi:polysaccharide deacetylase family protein [Microvirga lotononidis]|nr:polysaccharide deacetylase family protein [Microvirga lotononidis]WQO26858.1 polysaccharide deacetylase family protein [Microvirga lotononidis]
MLMEREVTAAMPRVLTYHDVVEEHPDASGFPGGGPALYKLPARVFARHLDAIAATAASPILLPQLRSSHVDDATPLLITFDDGGVSAANIIADALERKGWRGHFFVTTDYIGRKGFMTSAQIRDLTSRGHIIGTHSCSHPRRMSACSPQILRDEWHRSRMVLSEILDKPVTAGSVPGGYYSENIAIAAAASGLTDLFTSEPTTRMTMVNGLRVYGRFSIYRRTPLTKVTAIASGRRLAIVREAVAWELKKAIKLAGGETYLKLRKLILDRQHRYLL